MAAKKKEIKSRKNSESIKALITAPRFTEKATFLAEKENAYTFTVAYNANKSEIIKAIELLYGITPKKVAIVKRIPRKGAVRGRIVHIEGEKKAYVYLKKGDKLTLM